MWRKVSVANLRILSKNVSRFKMDDSHFNFAQQKQKHHHLVSLRKTEVEKQLVIDSALKQNYSFKYPKSSFAVGMC